MEKRILVFFFSFFLLFTHEMSLFTEIVMANTEQQSALVMQTKASQDGMEVQEVLSEKTYSEGSQDEQLRKQELELEEKLREVANREKEWFKEKEKDDKKIAKDMSQQEEGYEQEYSKSEDKSIWSGIVADSYAGGTGTEKDPYQISNIAELAYYAEADSSHNYYYVITKDIYINTGNSYVNNWCGYNAYVHGKCLDGKGHTIYGLYNSCLFIGGLDQIKNLTIKNAYYTTADNGLGFFKQASNCNISNCHMYGEADISETSVHEIAGLATSCLGAIKDCSNHMNIHIGKYTGTENIEINGISSSRGGTIEHCENHGTLSVDKGEHIKIAGISAGGGILDGCENYGNIILPATETYSNVNDGIGRALYQIKDCTNHADLNGGYEINGVGICDGYNNTKDPSCETGIISCSNEGNCIGGEATERICGIGYVEYGPYDEECDVKIRNCINKGALKGGEDVMGIGSDFYCCDYIGCENRGDLDGQNAFGIAEYLWIEKNREYIVENCSNLGSVHGSNYSGAQGMIGSIYTADSSGITEAFVKISNCKNSGNVKSDKGSAFGFVGYIASPNGDLTVQLSDCVNYGNVVSEDNEEGSSSGFLFASLDSKDHLKIANCINYGNISGKDASGFGAIVVTEENSSGSLDKTEIINCINEGDITGYDDASGLLSSVYNSKIMYCENRGKVESGLNSDGKDYSSAFGIVGHIYSASEIFSCANSGNITAYQGTLTSAAGICGSLSLDRGSTIHDCYNCGIIRAEATKEKEKGDTTAAAIVNNVTVITKEIKACCNCYNRGDISVFGVADSSRNGKMIGNISHYGGIGMYNLSKYKSNKEESVIYLTDEQMKDYENFSGFDFENIWLMGEGYYPYPILMNISEEEANGEEKIIEIAPEELSIARINGGSINGQGNAYVRYELKNSSKSILSNTTILYQYDGENRIQRAKSDENGWIVIPTSYYKNISKKQKKEKCIINLEPVNPLATLERNQLIISVTVNPVVYTESINGIGKAGVMAKEGIGFSIEAGPVRAGAMASAGVGAGKSSGLSGSITNDASTGKKAMQIKASYGGKIEGKAEAGAGIGWGKDAKEKIEDGNLDLTIGSIGAGAELGMSNEFGVNIIDCDNITSDEFKKLGLLMGAFYTNLLPNSEFMTYLVNMMAADKYDAYSSEVSGIINANAKLVNFKLGNISANLAGTGGNYCSNYKMEVADTKNTYSTQMVLEENASFLDTDLEAKWTEAVKTKMKLTKFAFSNKNNAVISATLDKNKLKSLALKSATTDDKGFSVLNRSVTKYQTQTVDEKNADKLIERDENLKSLTKGNAWMPMPSEFSNSMKVFYDSDIANDLFDSEEEKTSFSFPLSAGIALGEGLELNAELSGCHTNAYDTGNEKQYDPKDFSFSSSYVVGTISEPQSMIPKDSGQFQKVLKSAAKQFGKMALDYVKAIPGKVWSGVKNEMAEIKKSTKKLKNRTVMIVSAPFNKNRNKIAPDFLNTIYSADKLGDASLVEGQATAIGLPYLVYVSDGDISVSENGITVSGNSASVSENSVSVSENNVSLSENSVILEDFSDEPLTFRISYDEGLLQKAGVGKEQTKDIHMYYYNKKSDSYECLEGTLNYKEMYFETDIYRSGEYILGVDYAAPVVADFYASDQSLTPTICAAIYDISGIASVSMYIDGKEVISDNNKDKYLDGHMLIYQVDSMDKLSVGKHRASLTVTDTSGNSMKQPEILEFEVESQPTTSQPDNTNKPNKPGNIIDPSGKNKVAVMFNPIARPAAIGTRIIIKGNTYKVISSNQVDPQVELADIKFSAKKVAVPDSIVKNGVKYRVTRIGNIAFCYSNVKQVTIGKNVTTIGKEAFLGCYNLKKIIIKSLKLKKIGKNAFKGLNNKAVIKVPKSKKKKYKKLFKKKGQAATVTIK